MLWERWIPESYLTKSSVCGIECVYSESGLSFNYAILSVQKKKIEISSQGSTGNRNEIPGLLKKSSIPVVLAVVGKGVIVKRIIFSENDSLNITDLIKQHLPTVSVDDFYIQFFKCSGNTGYLTLCRKEQVDSLLTQFT